MATTKTTKKGKIQRFAPMLMTTPQVNDYSTWESFHDRLEYSVETAGAKWLVWSITRSHKSSFPPSSTPTFSFTVKPSKKKDQQDKENVASALDTADLNSAVDIHKLRQKHEELHLKNEMVRRKKRADIQKDSPLAMSRGGPAISGSEMKKLNDQIGVLEKKLSKSEDKVENRGKQIEKLDEENKALQTELGGVKTELASTKTEHKKTLKELETLKKKVTALEQKIRDMQGKSANPKAEVCEDIAALLHQGRSEILHVPVQEICPRPPQ